MTFLFVDKDMLSNLASLLIENKLSGNIDYNVFSDFTEKEINFNKFQYTK